MTVMGDALMDRLSDRGSIPLRSTQKQKSELSDGFGFSACAPSISAVFVALFLLRVALHVALRVAFRAVYPLILTGEACFKTFPRRNGGL